MELLGCVCNPLEEGMASLETDKRKEKNLLRSHEWGRVIWVGVYCDRLGIQDLLILFLQINSVPLDISTLWSCLLTFKRGWIK